MFWALFVTIWAAVTVSSSDAVKTVYTRAYKGKNLGVARQYHAQYFTVARIITYTAEKKWSSSVPCGNFEANSEGKYMGFFNCELDFEPPNFDYCCGLQGAHYCCPNASLATPYEKDPDLGNQGNTNDDGSPSSLYIGMAIFVPIIVTIGIGYRCLIFYHFKQRETNRSSQTTRNFLGEAALSDASGSNSQQAPVPHVPGFAYRNRTFAEEADAPPPYPGTDNQPPPPSYQTVMGENEPPPYPTNDNQ